MSNPIYDEEAKQDNTICLICRESFLEVTTDNIKQCVECNQKYHKSCIVRWCNEGNSDRGCPHCKDRRICILEQADYNRELSLAIANNQPINLLQHLIDNDADVNHIYEEGLTPLHLVCGLSNERLDIVTLLINNNAQFTSDNDNNTPIHLAAYKGHINIINLLINRFFDSGFLKNTVTTEPPISLEQVINSKNGDGFTPIILATSQNSIPVISILLDNGVDINVQDDEGDTPLQAALIYKYYDAADFLHSKGAIIDNRANNDGFTLLHASVNAEFSDFVQKCIDNGLDINYSTKDGYAPLHFAAMIENPTIFQMLVDNNADINKEAERYKETPLLIAILNNSPSIVKILLDKGVNVHCKDIDGDTPLHIAAQKNIELLRLLTPKYDSLDLKNNNGVTPLHKAAMYNKYENIEFLLSDLGLIGGVNINAIDNNGQTPLHWAIDNSNIESVRVLIKSSKADISIINSSGLNAQQIALETKRVLDENLKAATAARSAMIEIMANRMNLTHSRGELTDEDEEEERLRNQYTSMIVEQDSVREKYDNAVNILKIVTEYQSQQGTISTEFVGGMNTDDFEEIGDDNFSDIQSDFYSDPLDNSSHSIRRATRDLRNRDMKVALDLIRKLRSKKERREQERLDRELMDHLYHYQSIHFREAQRLDSPTDIELEASEDEELVNIVNTRMRRLGISGDSLYYDIKDLLNNGANPNYINEYDNTPLIIAAKNDWRNTVILLLKYGADIELEIPQKGTPLIQAVNSGHYEMVLLLIKKGANVNHVQNVTNMTALHWATVKGNKKIVELLLKNGANPDLKARPWQWTPWNRSDGYTALELGINFINDHRQLVSLNRDSPSELRKMRNTLKVFQDYYAQKAVDKGMVAEVGAMYKVKLPANISGEYGANVEGTDFKDGEIQKFLGGMKPEDLTPEKLKELEPYLSSNSENSLYEYLDIFDKKHPRFYCKSVESKLDELEKWMIHTLLRLQGVYPSASFYIGGRVIPNTPLRRDIHFTTLPEAIPGQEDVNETKLETEEDIKKFIRFFKKQPSNEILKLFNMFVLSNPILHHHTGIERYIVLDLPVVYSYYLFEHGSDIISIVGNNRVVRAYDRENSNNYRFGIGGLVTIDGTAVPHLGLDATMVQREIDAHEELRLNIKAFQKKIIRICSYNAIEKSRKRFEDESNNILLEKEEEESLWSAVYNQEFYENMENGMSEDEANIQASKRADEVVADKKRDYGDSLEKLFSDLNV